MRGIEGEAVGCTANDSEKHGKYAGISDVGNGWIAECLGNHRCVVGCLRALTRNTRNMTGVVMIGIY